MYYVPNNQKVHNIKSKVYIASYLRTGQDEDLNQIKIYDEPVKYMLNVQPVTETSQIRQFGELANSMRVAIVPKSKYLGKFKEFDVAYLDDATPLGELNNGDNANYRIYSVRNQNSIIMIYFVKMVENNL